MTLRSRRSRRQTPGRYKLHKPVWIDPYAAIPGTEPEKRVFEMLVKMHVYFIFQGQAPEMEKGHPFFKLAPVGYKPDFVLPEYKLIIDPFSPFHHSLKDAAARDRDKIAVYSAAGYAYYHPWAVAPGRWSWDQQHNQTRVVQFRGGRVKLYQGVNADRNSYRKLNRALTGPKVMDTLTMLYNIPELNMGPRYPLTDPRDLEAKRRTGYRVGEFVGAGANSVAAANRTRRKPHALIQKQVRSR